MLWKWWNIFDPLSLSPSLFLDRKRSGFVLENTDRITQWNDISGNNNHATAATGSAARPTLGADGVVFDGVGNYLITDNVAPILTGNTYNTIFLLFERSVTTSEYVLMAGSTTSPLPIYGVGLTDTTALYRRNIALATLKIVQAETEISLNTKQIGTYSYAGIGTSCLNGGSCGSLDISMDISVNMFSVGARRYQSSVVNFFTGTLHTVLTYPRVLTNSERTEVEAYLAREYGVTL